MISLLMMAIKQVEDINRLLSLKIDNKGMEVCQLLDKQQNWISAIEEYLESTEDN